MSEAENRERSGREGGATAEEGTPVPVDTSVDRWAQTSIVVLLAGPVIWAVHFLLVYAVSEAGCTGSGAGLELLDPPVPTAVTLVATAVGVLACLGTAWWGLHRWRIGRYDPNLEDPPTELEDRQLGALLDLSGAALSVLFAVSVAMVGLPAVWLTC